VPGCHANQRRVRQPDTETVDRWLTGLCGDVRKRRPDKFARGLVAACQLFVSHGR